MTTPPPLPPPSPPPPKKTRRSFPWEAERLLSRGSEGYQNVRALWRGMGRTNTFLFGTGLVILALVICLAIVGFFREGRERNERLRVEREQSKRTEEIRRENLAKQRRLREEALARQLKWSYTESKDEITNKTIRAMTVHSLNEIHLPFPYQGAQRARLTFRNHPRWGWAVFVQITRGQLLPSRRLATSRYSDLLFVRFGEEAATELVEYRGERSSTGESNLLFITPSKDFMAKTKEVDKIWIEVPVYNAGRQVLEFDVSGYSQSYRPNSD